MQAITHIIDSPGLSLDTIKTYNSLIREFSFDAINRKNVLSYLDRYPPRSRITAAYALKKAFAIKGIPWPLLKGDLPRVNPMEGRFPVLSPEDIRNLIIWSKKDGDDATRAFIALSTTYGFRLGELASLDCLNIDLKERRLTIQTEKKGIMRVHSIPQHIFVFLKEYPFPKIGKSQLDFMLKRALALVGIEREKGTGFHAIRRSLITQLFERGIPIWDIFKFFGWRNTEFWGLPRMPMLYYHPEQASLDERIFRVHPFLGLWR